MIRTAGIVLAGLAVAAVGILVTREPEPPRGVAVIPDGPVLFARDGWVRAPGAKLAAAAVGGCHLSSGSGDLDGDGGIDTVLAYSRGLECGEPDQVAVLLATGDVLGGPIESAPDGKTGRTCPGGCTVFAVSDLNTDGRAEVVLELSRGASQIQIGAYRLGSRGLAPLELGDGHATFSYGGSVCCGGRVSCRGQDRVVVSGYGATIFGSVWVGETVFRFDGRRFVQISARAEQRAGFDARGTSVPGRDCIAPRPVRNVEAELHGLLRGDL